MVFHGACRQPAAWTAALLLTGVLGACAVQPRPDDNPPPSAASRPASPAPASAATRLARSERVVARNDRFLIYVPQSGETPASIAKQFLGGEDRAWMIVDFNGIAEAKPGQPLVVPLQSTN